jgi:hypothetical protein
MIACALPSAVTVPSGKRLKSDCRAATRHSLARTDCRRRHDDDVHHRRGRHDDDDHDRSEQDIDNFGGGAILASSGSGPGTGGQGAGDASASPAALAVTGAGAVAPIALVGALLVMIGIVGRRMVSHRRGTAMEPWRRMGGPNG